MKSVISIVAVLAAVAASCGLATAREQVQNSAVPSGPQGDYPVLVGGPFTVGAVTYTPADVMNYDAVGTALVGAGEGISGAHRTLPVPSYVEVTSLDTGHTVLVRLDRRRGPSSEGTQLIELSPMAWDQLGVPKSGDAPVRVRRVNPPEQERALLRTGQLAPARMDTPPGLLAALRRKLGVAPLPVKTEEVPPAMPTTSAATLPPKPATGKKQTAPAKVVTPPHASAAPKPAAAAEPVPKSVVKPPKPVTEGGAAHSTSNLVVQVGAFSTQERAKKAAEQVGGAVVPAGKLFRVRIEANSKAEADAALAKARHSGYGDARIQHGK
jgi:rare lipoprotein A